MNNSFLFPRTFQLFCEIHNQYQCKNDFLDEIQWQALEKSINVEWENCIEKLQYRYDTLSKGDVYLIILILIGMNNSQITQLFHIELSSLRKRRYRIVKKMKAEGAEGVESLNAILHVFLRSSFERLLNNHSVDKSG